ncbi:MAG TPA: hypothetical protein VJ020_14750 [Anaerolineales bacterium]|nr:hypothetical protein [Anaerolineales bacterium]
MAHRLRKQQIAEGVRLLARYRDLVRLTEELLSQQSVLVEEQRALLKEQQELLRWLLSKQ